MWETGHDKLAWLLRTLPSTHIVFAWQQTRIKPFLKLVEEARDLVRRVEPVEVINFPMDASNCIDADFVVAAECSGTTVHWI